MRRSAGPLLLGALVLAATAQAPAGPPVASAHHAISSKNPAVQAAFDRALALRYTKRGTVASRFRAYADAMDAVAAPPTEDDLE